MATNKGFRVSAVFIIISLLVVAFPMNSSAATPIYVRPSGHDSNCNGTAPNPYDPSYAPTCAFRTITKGIEEVSNSGIVNVATGIYDEAVNLNRNVTVVLNSVTTITGNLTIQNGIFTAPPTTLSLQGNFIRTGLGTFERNVSTVVFNGSTPQTIGGTIVTSFNNLIINNPESVSLGFNESLVGTLTLQSGSLILGPYILEFGAQATAVGPFSENNMIVADGSGMLCKGFANNYSGPWPTTPFTFPIGDRTGVWEYSPATLSFSSGTFGNAPKACVRVVDARDPRNFFPNHLTRSWVMNKDFITNYSANLSFQYIDSSTATDVVGLENSLVALTLEGQNWILGNPTNTATNIFDVTTDSFTTFTAGGNVSPVVFDSLTSLAEIGKITAFWRTTYENGILGYNLYKSENLTIPVSPINTTMIPAQMTCSLSVPCYYQYVDNTAVAGTTYNYWVEVIYGAAQSEYFGPVTDAWFYYIYLPLIRKPNN